LADFLDALAGRWNISLFHYRNHGSDFGRVLAGLEVEESDLAGFRSFLDGLGYEYTIESENPAYRFFLG
jgi:threonine dehydratase